MPDYGIKILKPSHSMGVDVFSATPKDLIILSNAESHKVAFNGSLTDPTSNFTHSLGYIPFMQGYYEDGSGDLYPLGYVDDQVYDTMFMSTTTSAASFQRYSGGTLLKRYYTIYYEN